MTETSLAPPEAVASFLRPYFPESARDLHFWVSGIPGELDQFAAAGVGGSDRYALGGGGTPERQVR